jgi:aspartyl protease family protein
MTSQASLTDYLLGQPLILVVVIALLLAALGWRLELSHHRLGSMLRTAGYLGMLATGSLIVIDVARKAESSDVALELVGRTRAEVVGGETVIPLGADGHFRVVATINGKELPVLIDTGATYTSMEEKAAKRLEIGNNPQRLPVELGTANGTISARFGLADEIRLGSINARNVDVAITPDTNNSVAVIGMDLLSRLEGWRVENGKLILSPARP